jgi:hypothetical protein
MTEWKLVPAKPTPAMSAAGFLVSEAEHDPAGVYRAMLAAAPTPPVVLPPLPKSFTILSRLQSGTEEVVRLDEAVAYARAALAQYGIVEKNDD